MNLLTQYQSEIARVLSCGCWIVTLAQGKAILPCATHENNVLAFLREE